jgi:hypothetical protein
MKKEDKFFLVVLFTILAFRIVLFLLPSDLFIFNDYYHHIYTGVILVFIFAIYNYELHHKLFYPFAIAIGMIVDELVYLMPFFVNSVGKGSYFSFYSFLFMLFGLVVVFVTRKMFVKEVLDTRG